MSLREQRVELQAEVSGERARLFSLVATAAGLRRWLDGVEMDAAVGSACRFRLAEAVAVGRVLAIAPPQHISFSWDWEAEPLDRTSVVAFDLIDHGARTHLTLRHVGLDGAPQRELHEAMWREWFGRLIAASGQGDAPDPGDAS